MNITFVSDAVYPYNKGGKEKRLYELSTRLARKGHDVHIYTMHWWKGPEQSRTEDGVQLHAISKYWPMYQGDKRSIQEGVMFGLACFKIFRVKFDVLDVDHMPFFPVYSCWLVCLLRGKKMYGTWHESLSRDDWKTYMGKPGAIAYAIEHISIKLPHVITAASAQTKQLLASIHGRSKHVELVSSGIDTKLLAKLKPAPIACDVLYTGRLVKDKNIDKLVRAMAVVAKTNPSIRCTIVGHGIEKPQLEKLITQLKLKKQVNLLDPLADAQDVYRYMKAAKVFVLPSVREGFGIVALEALGCGTPVITIDSPSNAARHLIQEGVNGSIVSLDPKALAAAIIHWVTTKPTDFSKQVSSYDWDTLAQTQSKVYAV